MNSSEETPYVEVRFEIEKDKEGYPKSRDAEALRCTPLDTDCSLCVVASVPFYLRHVAYGDTIRTEDNPSGYLEFKETVERGGYSVYRVLLHDPTKKDELINWLLDHDALVEHDGNLISIAIHSNGRDRIVDHILEGKNKGLWGAQDGYVFEHR